jgi:hypothetical protein
MSKAGLDNRHRNKDGEISHKHGNSLIRTLRKIYGQGFAAGYPETERGSASTQRDIPGVIIRPATWVARSPKHRSDPTSKRNSPRRLRKARW